MAEKKPKKPFTIEEWGREIYKFSGMPNTLAKINVQLSGQYGALTTKYIGLKLLSAKFYDEWKHEDDGKKRSDKWIENMWLISEDGAEWYKTKRELKAYESMMQACKTATYVANAEARNQQ